jgi:glycosyltransferase involved in cell wall biosynthesis
LELLSLSVFFPAHNEAGNIERVVRSAIETCGPLTRELEVIVVDDGSSDDTADIVRRLSESDARVRLVRHEVNRGYGGALKSGFKAARNEYVFFTDGDGQFDITEVRLLMPLLADADLVVGYRLRRSDPWYRLVNARLYHWLIRVLFGLSVRDVDCAFKLFRRSVLAGMELRSEGALISAEFLIRARAAGHPIAEVGVHHFPRQWGAASGARLAVIARMFWELFRFRMEMTRAKKSEGQAKELDV